MIGHLSTQCKLRLEFRNFFEKAIIDNDEPGSMWGDKLAELQPALR